MSKLIGIDLFAGIGGLSLGATAAGIDVAIAFEKQRQHVEVYRKNHDAAVEERDVAKVTGSEISAFLGDRRVHIVFGGPPCQGFSLAGNRKESDPRNLLLFEPLRIASELNAPYFLIENVPALTSLGDGMFLRQLFHQAQQLGYKIKTPLKILIASNYRVPQRRKRLFILGYREGVKPPEYPSPKEHSFAVQEALEDLPDPIVHASEASNPFYRYRLWGNRYAQYLNSQFPDPRFDGEDWRDRKVTSHFLTRHNHETISRFRKLGWGNTDPKTRHRRLYGNRPAFTLRAGTTDGSRTALRPLHYRQHRVITVREAARLHSFPDWFEFHPTKIYGYQGIGNSVCPLLSKAIFEQFL